MLFLLVCFYIAISVAKAFRYFQPYPPNSNFQSITPFVWASCGEQVILMLTTFELENVNWPPERVKKLTFRALALRQSDWCGDSCGDLGETRISKFGASHCFLVLSMTNFFQFFFVSRNTIPASPKATRLLVKTGERVCTKGAIPVLFGMV